LPGVDFPFSELLLALSSTVLMIGLLNCRHDQIDSTFPCEHFQAFDENIYLRAKTK